MTDTGAASPQVPMDRFCAPKTKGELSSLPRGGRWEGPAPNAQSSSKIVATTGVGRDGDLETGRDGARLKIYIVFRMGSPLKYMLISARQISAWVFLFGIF